MPVNLLRLLPHVLYERLKSGDHLYRINSKSAQWLSFQDKLEVAIQHPVLIPIFDLLGHYFSNVKFYIEENGEPNYEHKELALLNNPNHFQSTEDFLTEHIIYKYVFGWLFVYAPIPTGFDKPTQIYNLNSGLVDFPQGFEPKMPINDRLRNEIDNTRFSYDKQNNNLSIKIKDVVNFFDLPNQNKLIGTSRLGGLVRPLSNVLTSMEAKNIVLQSNGKELFSTRSSSGLSAGMLSQPEKEDVKKRINENYGLSTSRSRAIITKADLRWQSLHIPLADLGLDESVGKDAQSIVTAFNIPKELINFTPEGSTYENQEQAKIGFLQEVIYKHINDFCNSYTKKYLKGGLKLKGSLDHLPIMKATEMRRVRNIKAYVEALAKLIEAGVITPDEAKVKLNEYEKE